MNRSAPDQPSDVELVRQAQSGVRAAFDALVVRYQDRIYNACYRMCHDPTDAADLAQTAFMKAFEGLRRFETRASFYTWLFRIAFNVTMSHRRSAGRRPRSLDDPQGGGTPAGERVTAGTEDAGAAAERAELRERVAAALAQLEPEYRAAVVLKDIEDLDYAAIAEILEVPIGTVKSRIHRGRMMLRDLLSTRTDLDRARA